MADQRMKVSEQKLLEILVTHGCRKADITKVLSAAKEAKNALPRPSKAEVEKYAETISKNIVAQLHLQLPDERKRRTFKKKLKESLVHVFYLMAAHGLYELLQYLYSLTKRFYAGVDSHAKIEESKQRSAKLFSITNSRMPESAQQLMEHERSVLESVKAATGRYYQTYALSDPLLQETLGEFTRFTKRAPYEEAIGLAPQPSNLMLKEAFRQFEVNYFGHQNDKVLPVGKVPSQADTKVEAQSSCDVWYATTREPKDRKDHSKGFKNLRDETGAVHYGKCTVYVPKSHRFGSTGTVFWRRWLERRWADDHLKLTKITPLNGEREFFANLAKAFSSVDEKDRIALIYIHGFYVSFKEAAIRAAQMGLDLKIPGATAFFSWPSKARLSRQAYQSDEDRVHAAEQELATFIADFAAKTGAQSVNIIAHSMGNRGLARAIQRIVNAASVTSGVILNQIILAAPDIEATLFKDLAALYPKIAKRTTMYVSAKDKALQISKFIHDSVRAGYTPPVTIVPGIDTVEVTNIDLTLLGHGYYAEAEPVIYDMSDVIRHNSQPSARLRLLGQPDDANPTHWMVRA